MKRIKQNEKGITLIALVITIIVLLILAGVTIATLTGENGILGRATETRSTNAEAQADEKAKLAYMGIRTEIIVERVADASYNAQNHAGKLGKMVKKDLSSSNWTVKIGEIIVTPPSPSDEEAGSTITMIFNDSSLNNTKSKTDNTNEILYEIVLPATGTEVTLKRDGEPMSSGGNGSSGDNIPVTPTGIPGVDFGSKTPTTIDVGEDLTITINGTVESFRVLKTDKSSEIIAVPHNNITKSTTNPVQTQPTDWTNHIEKFANNGDKYWTEGQDDIDWKDERCLIGPYVQAYSDKLNLITGGTKTNGVIAGGKVTARLGRYSEFQDSAIILPADSTVTKARVKNPDNSNSSQFWLGSSSNETGLGDTGEYLYYVYTDRKCF